ncbi:hypothetical protein UFOVP1015_17 [uncultured Caudovirales phage]|uniref:Uncharacterized protein n=1 Tax=uncultured Caudovirales phage TaxID=2100421 RepID=A0A6J5Q6E3_9CAUD|nr:hypothetical protein UFOVP1015_17 [uncultured Caudovirales phage]CAB5229394.1 hypothetical protein UFOVP1551_48 [uncultured Caudovirales phage]
MKTDLTKLSFADLKALKDELGLMIPVSKVGSERNDLYRKKDLVTDEIKNRIKVLPYRK